VLDGTQEDFRSAPRTDDTPDYIVVGDLSGS
jgi:hypothetical protein